MATAKRTTAVQAIPASNAVRLPSERLQKLLADTHRPEAYPVADGLSISYPSKKRRDDLRDAQMEIAVAQEILDQLMRHVLPTRPEFPVPPEPPTAKATKAQFAAYETAADSYQTMVNEWTRLNQEWQDTVTKHQDTLNATAARITEHSHRFTRALFGEVYDDVIGFFDEQDPELWDAFQVDLQRHFRIIPTPPEVPDDGVCPTCGQVEDVEQAGKARKSSA